jgi:magnesium transporter
MPQVTELDEARAVRLVTEVEQRAPSDAVKLLETLSDRTVAEVLSRMNPSIALNVLLKFDAPRRQRLLAEAPQQCREQWTRNQTYPEGSVGRLMEPPAAVFSPEMTVQQAVDRIRDLVKTTFVTYGYVAEADGMLLGVLVMRDLLLASPAERLSDVMVREPFSLTPSMPVSEAMQEALHRHYPVYPVCDEKGRFVGLVRGYVLFEEQTLEISAQPGRMVGIEEEERLSTHWIRSLWFRHPWLQLNLLTAFLAAAVVGIFEGTINQIVALAVFLPVLAGQSGNTGCQALAVTLRGITLGEMRTGKAKLVVTKEAWLGLLNGMLVGVTAALGMYIYATMQGHGKALILALVVFLAMVGSCLISGLSGALVPLCLKRLGADPATASSIFLTTATDVASMGLFLWLATVLVL